MTGLTEAAAAVAGAAAALGALKGITLVRNGWNGEARAAILRQVIREEVRTGNEPVLDVLKEIRDILLKRGGIL